MPSDSQFAVAMRNQQEAERAEQQRIKSLVLNYDLQDAAVDQSSTGSDNIHFDPFLTPNPNLSPSPGTQSFPLPEVSQGKYENNLAHGIHSQGSGDKHQHNASLHQHAPHHSGGGRSTDKSSSNRSAQRSRKLQLSDVDW